MSLSDLAALGSFVSGIAVLASLVFLYFQLRQINAQVKQTERNQRALIHQGRTVQTTDRLFRYAEPAFVTPMLKVILGREPVQNEIEFQQFALLLTVTFREMQDVFFQRDIGLLDEAAVNNHLAALRPALSSAAGKAVWKLLRAAYDPAFVARVDAFERSLPVQSGLSGFEQYHAELAKITTGA